MTKKDLKDLKDADKGRAVRYTSASGHTVLDGVLDSWDARWVYVRFGGGSYKTGPDRQEGVVMDTSMPVQVDPLYLEFA